jgi:hypothetical protein
MHPLQDSRPLQGSGSAPPPPLLYAPVSVGGWHFPDLDAFQGPFTPHHHTQVGILVGIVALGLCGAVGPTGPTCGEQPLNCGTKGETVTYLTWPSLLHGPPWAVLRSVPWAQTHVPRWHQSWGKKHWLVIQTKDFCRELAVCQTLGQMPRETKMEQTCTIVLELLRETKRDVTNHNTGQWGMGGHRKIQLALCYWRSEE